MIDVGDGGDGLLDGVGDGLLDVARRMVKVGVDLGDRLEIAEGLKPGEVVVADGVDSVFDGAPVRFTLPKAAPPPDGSTGSHPSEP